MTKTTKTSLIGFFLFHIHFYRDRRFSNETHNIREYYCCIPLCEFNGSTSLYNGALSERRAFASPSRTERSTTTLRVILDMLSSIMTTPVEGFEFIRASELRLYYHPVFCNYSVYIDNAKYLAAIKHGTFTPSPFHRFSVSVQSLVVSSKALCWKFLQPLKIMEGRRGYNSSEILSGRKRMTNSLGKNSVVH